MCSLVFVRPPNNCNSLCLLLGCVLWAGLLCLASVGEKEHILPEGWGDTQVYTSSEEKWGGDEGWIAGRAGGGIEQDVKWIKLKNKICSYHHCGFVFFFLCAFFSFPVKRKHEWLVVCSLPCTFEALPTAIPLRIFFHSYNKYFQWTCKNAACYLLTSRVS